MLKKLIETLKTRKLNKELRIQENKIHRSNLKLASDHQRSNAFQAMTGAEINAEIAKIELKIKQRGSYSEAFSRQLRAMLIAKKRIDCREALQMNEIKKVA